MPTDSILLGSGLEKTVGRKAAISTVAYLRALNPEMGDEEMKPLILDHLGMFGLLDLESEYTHKLTP